MSTQQAIAPQAFVQQALTSQASIHVGAATERAFIARLDPAAPASINAAINITLLNTDLAGVFERSHDETTKTTKTRVLVMPTDEPRGGMSILQMITAVKQMIKKFTGQEATIDTESIKATLGQFGADLESVFIELRQVFFLYEKTGTAEQNPPGESSLEYAINIVVRSALELPEDLKNLFSFKNLSFAIWNTTRPRIIERMELGDIDSLLA